MIGQNPKTSHNIADDMSDITALLQTLPRVSAPTDFNAALKARLAVATAAEKEFAPVTAMIKELPRVAAPPDFDFRLRARIAQAKAEQEKVSGGWLSALFGQSFSWLQASAAMAAIALVVSVITWGTLRSNNPSNPVDSNIATTGAPAPVKQQSEVAAPPKVLVEDSPKDTYKPLTVSTAALSKTPRGMKALQPAPLPAAPKDAPVVNVSDSTRAVIIKRPNGETQVVYLAEQNLGLQATRFRAAPTSAKKQPEATSTSNIY